LVSRRLIAVVVLAAAGLVSSGSCDRERAVIAQNAAAAEILRATEDAYSRSRVYRDSGTVVRMVSLRLAVVKFLQSGAWHDSFHTMFVRGKRYEFTYETEARQRFSATGDDVRGEVISPFAPKERLGSFDEALRSIAGVTAGVAAPVRDLFFARFRAGVRAVTRLPDRDVDGVRCAVIEAATSTVVVTLWVAPDFTVRRVQRRLAYGRQQLLSDATYDSVERR
jgi:hypothetical protein